MSQATPQNVVILGGPGDGVVAAEIIHAARHAGGNLELVGFLNDNLPKGTPVHGTSVLGTFEEWVSLPPDTLFLPAIHKVGDMKTRVKRFKSLGIPRERLASVHHPESSLASDVKLGRGILIASFVTIQPGCQIGDLCTLRAGANLGHDAVVGEFGYVGPNATLCGRAKLGHAVHVGPNAVVLDRVKVEDYAVVGIGSAVTKHVPAGSVMMGNPATVLFPRQSKETK